MNWLCDMFHCLNIQNGECKALKNTDYEPFYFTELIPKNGNVKPDLTEREVIIRMKISIIFSFKDSKIKLLERNDTFSDFDPQIVSVCCEIQKLASHENFIGFASEIKDFLLSTCYSLSTFIYLFIYLDVAI